MVHAALKSPLPLSGLRSSNTVGFSINGPSYPQISTEKHRFPPLPHADSWKMGINWPQVRISRISGYHIGSDGCVGWKGEGMACSRLLASLAWRTAMSMCRGAKASPLVHIASWNQITAWTSLFHSYCCNHSLCCVLACSSSSFSNPLFSIFKDIGLLRAHHVIDWPLHLLQYHCMHDASKCYVWALWQNSGAIYYKIDERIPFF